MKLCKKIALFTLASSSFLAAGLAHATDVGCNAYGTLHLCSGVLSVTSTQVNLRAHAWSSGGVWDLTQLYMQRSDGRIMPGEVVCSGCLTVVPGSGKFSGAMGLQSRVPSYRSAAYVHNNINGTRYGAFVY